MNYGIYFSPEKNNKMAYKKFIFGLGLCFLSFGHAEETCPVGNWIQGNVCCKTRGSQLPNLLNLEQSKTLIHKIEGKKYTAVWLGWRRHIFSMWTWVDDVFDNGASIGLEETGHCAYYNRSRMMIQTSSCNDGHGYICQKKPCRSCHSLPWGNHLCVHVAGSCFISICDRNSWFNNRAVCIRSGMDLAIIRPEDSLRPLLGDLDYCATHWIGLRKEDWFSGDSDTKETEVGIWQKGYPAAEGECAVLFKKQDEYHIKNSICSADFASICEPLQGVTTITPITPDEQSHVTVREERLSDVNIWMINTILTTVIIVFLLAALIVVRVKCHQLQRHTESAMRSVMLSEMLPLGQGREKSLYDRHDHRSLPLNLYPRERDMKRTNPFLNVTTF